MFYNKGRNSRANKYFGFFIVLFACTLGAISGLGGVIIKPLMDALGGFSAASVNAMASITILTMTIVSIIKSRRNALGINWRVVIFFTMGSMIGGVLGQLVLDHFIASTDDSTVIVVQSVCQIAIVVLIMVHELIKDKIPHYHVKNSALMLTVGIGLGTIAAFLSIGGGIFNRPLLVILLSMTSKSAVFSSLCIILCAQGANVMTMGVTNHFSHVDITVLPFMMVAAVLGGYLGGYIATHVNDKYFDRLFMLTLFIILCLNTGNLVRYLM